MHLMNSSATHRLAMRSHVPQASAAGMSAAVTVLVVVAAYSSIERRRANGSGSGGRGRMARPAHASPFVGWTCSCCCNPPAPPARVLCHSSCLSTLMGRLYTLRATRAGPTHCCRACIISRPGPPCSFQQLHVHSRGPACQSQAPPTLRSIFATTSSVSLGSTASAAMLSSICAGESAPGFGIVQVTLASPAQGPLHR